MVTRAVRSHRAPGSTRGDRFVLQRLGSRRTQRGCVGEGVKKRYYRAALCRGQLESRGGERGIGKVRAESGAPAVLVEVHHLVERRVGAVVHVGRGHGGVTKRGHLERVEMLGQVIDTGASGVGIDARTAHRGAREGAYYLRLGARELRRHHAAEERSEVTGAAARLPHEEREAESFASGESECVAANGAIEAGVEGVERAKIRGERDAHVASGDGVIPRTEERASELLADSRVAREMGSGESGGTPHLGARGEDDADLILEREGALVGEVEGLIGDVEKR